MLYKGKPSNAENFFQHMDVLCLLPPLSFVTITASWEWWWYVNLNPRMRSWVLSPFSGVYSGTTKIFLTLSTTSRWNDLIVNSRMNGQLPTSVSATHICSIYRPYFFSLSIEDATLGIQVCWHLTSAEKSSIFSTYLELCLHCGKAREMEIEFR